MHLSLGNTVHTVVPSITYYLIFLLADQLTFGAPMSGSVYVGLTQNKPPCVCVLMGHDGTCRPAQVCGSLVLVELYFTEEKICQALENTDNIINSVFCA